MDGMEDEGFEGLNSLNNNTTTNVAVAIWEEIYPQKLKIIYLLLYKKSNFFFSFI